MAEFLKGIIAAALIFIGGLYGPRFESWLSDSPEPVLNEISSGSGLIVAALSIVIYSIFAVIIEKYKKIALNVKIIRRNFISPAAYEGFWISRVSVNGLENLSRWSISKIYYSSTASCWIYHGFTFDDHYQRLKEWKLFSIHFDKSNSEWFFDGNYWHHTKVRGDPHSAKTQGSDHFAILEIFKKDLNGPIVSRFIDNRKSAGHLILTTGRESLYRIPPDFLVMPEARQIDSIDTITSSDAQTLIEKCKALAAGQPTPRIGQ